METEYWIERELKMLTKKILKYVRKAEKARLAGNEYLSTAYRAAAIELIKQCRNVTEDEFHQVFSHAIIEARDIYWLAMHAKEQWGEPEETINDVPNGSLIKYAEMDTSGKVHVEYWPIVRAGIVQNSMLAPVDPINDRPAHHKTISEYLRKHRIT